MVGTHGWRAEIAPTEDSPAPCLGELSIRSLLLQDRAICLCFRLGVAMQSIDGSASA